MKADKIIATGEIDFLEKQCEKYNIKQFDIEKSLGISFAEACETVLTQTPRREWKDIRRAFRELTLSDGNCSREEALLVMAMDYRFNENTRGITKLVSFKSADIDFVDSQVIFVEPNYNQEVNSIIESNLKRITNQMRIGGFEFIYIPDIAKHYQEMEDSALKKIIKYLAPTLVEEETEKVCESMREMTTKYFKNEILKEKLNISLVIDAPSLMVKIGNSYVDGDLTSDYLVLKLCPDIIEQVDELIENFLKLQRCPSITINYTDSGNDFVYTGIYKTIFDLITYRKGVRSSLIIDPTTRRKRLEIQSKQNTSLNLGLAETAFYVFLICETLSPRGGIVFTNKGKDTLGRIQHRYENVYHAFAGSRDVAPNITDSNTRNRMLSEIRKAINNNKDIIEKNIFMPDTNTSKIFIPIEEGMVFVQETITQTLGIRRCGVFTIE